MSRLLLEIHADYLLKSASETGFYLVVGGVVGVVVVAVFTVLILARRRNKKAIAPVDKEGKACYVSLHHKLMKMESFW